MTSTTPALTLDLARHILFGMEHKLHSIERLGRVVWLAGMGMEQAGSGADAFIELGEQIEALAKEIMEESYAWAAPDDGNGEAEEDEGDAS